MIPTYIYIHQNKASKCEPDLISAGLTDPVSSAHSISWLEKGLLTFIILEQDLNPPYYGVAG
jgi:hypothetical protein